MEIKSLLPWFLIICIVFLVLSIISNISQMLNAQGRVDGAEKKVLTLEKEQQRLIQEKSQQASQYYLESQIRNKLKLVKPGETLIITPQQLKESEEEEVYKYTPKEEKEIEINKPIEEWMELIL